MLLSEDDVDAVAAAIDPGSTAAVLVWDGRTRGPHRSRRPHAAPVDNSWLVDASRCRPCWPHSKQTRKLVPDMPLAARRLRRAAVTDPPRSRVPPPRSPRRRWWHMESDAAPIGETIDGTTAGTGGAENSGHRMCSQRMSSTPRRSGSRRRSRTRKGVQLLSHAV